MSSIEKKIKKFYQKPIPNDITFDEIVTLSKYFGCIVSPGGNHIKIIHVSSGYVIPIPVHGKTVPEVYIKQLKKLFDSLSSLEEK